MKILIPLGKTWKANLYFLSSRIVRVVKFKCKICGFVGESFHFTKTHCELDHTEAFADTSGSVRSVSEEDLGVTSAHLEAETKSRPSTPHTNMNWLNHIRSNYKKVVVSKCSQQTRQAVAGNENLKVTFFPTWMMTNIFLFKDPKKKNIRNELINTTIDFLGTIFGGVGTLSIFLSFY